VGRTAADNTDVDERWILIDRETGLHVSWYFWLRLLDEVGRSDRYGTSFGLLLLEPAVAAGSKRTPQEALAHVPEVIRGTDLGGIIGPARAAVILTQQDPASAEAATQRIRERLLPSAAEGISWSSDLLCYPRGNGGSDWARSTTLCGSASTCPGAGRRWASSSAVASPSELPVAS
jgi:hypothetical protein